MDIQTFDNLIDGYLDDRLSADELAVLNDALGLSAEARKRFWDQTQMEAALIELAERKVGEAASHRLAAEDAIQILRQLEELANPDLREVELPPLPIRIGRENPLIRATKRMNQWVTLSGPITRSLAAAAVIGIVVLLGWQLLNGSVTPPIAETNPTPKQTDDAPPKPIPQRAHAMLTRSFDAVWTGTAPPMGQSLDPAVQYSLTRGTVELKMSTGATVKLQAPARFAIHERNLIDLEQGRAYAAVPEQAIGFAIDTPQGRIVDLGTEFGVRVNPRGPAEVVVFKGLVEAVAADTTDEPVKIPANFGGQLQRGQPVANTIQQLSAFDIDLYTRSWEDVVYHPEVGGDAVYHPQAPASLLDNAFEADHIQVVAEARGVVLQAPLSVIKLSPGYGKQLAGGAQHTDIPAGTKVNAFLVHLDRTGVTGLGVDAVVAELTFPGEVLGVISEHRPLLASDSILGAENTRYPAQNQPSFRATSDPFNSPTVETVRLETDRRSLRVTMITSNVDAIRVIVRNTDDDEKPLQP